ncbi:hypothetical protein [Vibrio astriarenae]|uniref:hypothetical protein n=1 Tax=Vibrio astriarenae TaxID=1481923 RepID=UPI003736AA07
MLTHYDLPLEVKREILDLQQKNKELKRHISQNRMLIEISELKADRFKNLDTITQLNDIIINLKAKHANDLAGIQERHIKALAAISDERDLYFEKWQEKTSELKKLKGRLITLIESN